MLSMYTSTMHVSQDWKERNTQSVGIARKSHCLLGGAWSRARAASGKSNASEKHCSCNSLSWQLQPLNVHSNQLPLLPTRRSEHLYLAHSQALLQPRSLVPSASFRPECSTTHKAPEAPGLEQQHHWALGLSRISLSHCFSVTFPFVLVWLIACLRQGLTTQAKTSSNP